jgi:hypothetical protein
MATTPFVMFLRQYVQRPASLHHLFLDANETYGLGLRIAAKLGWTYVGLTDTRRVTSHILSNWMTHLVNLIPSFLSMKEVSYFIP